MTSAICLGSAAHPAGYVVNIEKNYSAADARMHRASCAVPLPADGELYQVGYRYALAPRSASFTDWQEARTLASFGWTDLGEFRRGKIAAQVWLALARRRVGEPEPRPALTAGTSFAVKAEIRPPYGQSPRLSADLVKGIIDGVVSAFQAHTDTSTSGEVAARLANVLPADWL